MRDPLQICVAGCGQYAQSVMDDLRGMEGAPEFAFASRDADKARSYCERYGGFAYFDSYEAAADDPRVDAVYFLTPHDLHAEHVRLAARRGKHVLMEKPIARTVSEAREMIDCVERAGVMMMIAENFRFDPAVGKARELIDAGAVGAVRFVEVRSEGMDVATGWRLSRSRTGGGRFIDGGIHYVDILRYLGGDVDLVYARQQDPTLTPGLEGEDGIALNVGFRGGGSGLLQYSGGTPISRKEHEARVTGAQGRLRLAVFGGEVTLETLSGTDVIPVEPAFRGVRRMLREFCAAAAQRREPLMNGSEALDDLRVVLAAYESARTGCPVNMDSIQ